MVDEADVVAAYVLHDWGGAAKTLDYAMKKRKTVICFGDKIYCCDLEENPL